MIAANSESRTNNQKVVDAGRVNLRPIFWYNRAATMIISGKRQYSQQEQQSVWSREKQF
jgi:hypothetical protein